MPSDVVLAYLQEAMVEAVLLQRNLPGGDWPVVLPDLGCLLREDRVLLADENLAETVSFSGAPVSVHVQSLDAIREQARALGQVAFLHFQPAEICESVIRITLQAKIAPQDPDQRALGLSGIQVQFEEKADGWQAAAGPVFFAA